MTASSRHIRNSRRSGLSLLEVVISTFLVGLVLAGAMTGLANVTRGRTVVSNAGRADQLAHQLLAEIVAQQYIDEGGSPVFGREAGEQAGGNSNRTNYDDVDDYHLYSQSPLKDRDGTATANTTGWQRNVTVAWVDPASPATVVGTDSGLKRITVVVSRYGQTLSNAVGLRAQSTSAP